MIDATSFMPTIIGVLLGSRAVQWWRGRRRRGGGVARDEVAWCGSAVPGWVSFGGYHHCLLVCIATDLTLPRVLSD